MITIIISAPRSAGTSGSGITSESDDQTIYIYREREI